MNIMIYHVMICGEQNGRLNNLIHLSENEVYPPANNRGSFGGSKQNCWFCSLVLGGHFLNLNDFCVWQFLRNKIADSDLTLLKVNQTLGNCPFWYGIFQSYSYVGFIRTVVPNMPTCSARVCQRSCSRLLHPKYLSSQGPEPEAVGKFLQKNDNDKENTWVCLKIMSPQTMPSLMGKLWLNIKFGRCPPFFWVLTWDLYTTTKKNNAVLSENDDNPSECGRLNDHPIWCPTPASSDKRSKSSSSSNGQSRMSKAKSCGWFSVQRCGDQDFNAIQLMVGLQFMKFMCIHGKILAAKPVFSNLNSAFNQFWDRTHCCHGSLQHAVKHLQILQWNSVKQEQDALQGCGSKPWDIQQLPSGKHTKNYGKSPCSMGKSTINHHLQ